MRKLVLNPVAVEFKNKITEARASLLELMRRALSQGSDYEIAAQVKVACGCDDLLAQIEEKLFQSFTSLEKPDDSQSPPATPVT